MLTDTSRWSHARGNEVVPYHWQATGSDRHGGGDSNSTHTRVLVRR